MTYDYCPIRKLQNHKSAVTEAFNSGSQELFYAIAVNSIREFISELDTPVEMNVFIRSTGVDKSTIDTMMDDSKHDTQEYYNAYLTFTDKVETFLINQREVSRNEQLSSEGI